MPEGWTEHDENEPGLPEDQEIENGDEGEGDEDE